MGLYFIRLFLWDRYSVAPDKFRQKQLETPDLIFTRRQGRIIVSLIKKRALYLPYQARKTVQFLLFFEIGEVCIHSIFHDNVKPSLGK